MIFWLGNLDTTFVVCRLSQKTHKITFFLPSNFWFKQQCFESIDEANGSKNTSENSQQTVQSVKEDTNPCEEPQMQKEAPGDEENGEESRDSVKKEISEHETEETQGSVSKSVPSKETIKNAIKKRASYFRANSAYVTSLITVLYVYYLGQYDSSVLFTDHSVFFSSNVDIKSLSVMVVKLTIRKKEEERIMVVKQIRNSFYRAFF